MSNEKEGEKFQPGNRAKVKDRPGWSEGIILEVKEDPKGYVVMVAGKTGYRMALPEWELEEFESS